MEKWPIGVFASIDAGLGVRLEVARELNVRTIHLHTPHRESRTPQRAEEFLQRLKKLDITVTVVFAGFEGESYADIPTVSRTVGLVPKETRRERTVELKEIADFARLLGVDKVGVHIGFVPHDRTMNEYRDVLAVDRQAYVRLTTALLERGVRALERGSWFLSTEHDTVDFYFVALPVGYVRSTEEEFNEAEMNRQFALGYQLGAAGVPWRRLPPGYVLKQQGTSIAAQ